MTDETKPELSLVENEESAELEEALSVECGICLYLTSEGLPGATDMSEDGGANRPIQDEEAMDLLQGALENVRLSRAVRAALAQFQAQMVAARQKAQGPRPGAIVNPLGQEVASADYTVETDTGDVDK